MASVIFRLCIRRPFSGQVIRKACTATNPMTASPPVQHHQWHIMSAVCLERKPVVKQEMTPLEKSYSALLKQLEHEQSLLSDHELRHLEDLKYAEKLKTEDEDIDLDHAAKQTAQDFEDASHDELEAFKPAPIATEADELNDLHSLDRKLQNHLLLIIKQKLGNDYRWILPQSVCKEEENLREAAERVIKETCGDQLQVILMGNAPAGFYKYKYPKAARSNGVLGAKVFFFKAQVTSGNVDQDVLRLNADVSDYGWATREELKEKLQPDYCKAVERFLIDEV